MVLCYSFGTLLVPVFVCVCVCLCVCENLASDDRILHVTLQFRIFLKRHTDSYHFVCVSCKHVSYANIHVMHLFVHRW